MGDVLLTFFNDERTLILLGLILINLVTGVMAALVRGVFELGKIAEFYQRRVLPYVLGYLLVYVLAATGIERLLGPLVGEITAWAGIAVAGVNLLDDIRRNLVDVGMPLPGKGSEPSIKVEGGATITPDAGATVTATPTPIPVTVMPTDEPAAGSEG